MTKTNKKEFPLSKEALDTHINFLRGKDPSIIGKTCRMLSALKIITLPDNEALPFVIGIIENLKRDGRPYWVSEEDWNDFCTETDTLDKYLRKILKEQKWIFSIERYIKQKILNAITVETRRRTRHDSLFVKREDEDGNLEVADIPALKGKFLIDDIENRIDVNRIFEKAKLTDREWKIYILKEQTPYTEKLIAEILKVSRDIVKHDYKEAKDKLGKLIKIISH